MFCVCQSLKGEATYLLRPTYQIVDVDLIQTSMPVSAVANIVIYTVMLPPLLTPLESTTREHLSSRDLHVDVTVSPRAPQLMFVGTQMQIGVVVRSTDNSTCNGEGKRLACDESVVLVMSARSI